MGSNWTAVGLTAAQNAVFVMSLFLDGKMTLTETTSITEKYRERCEDRVDVFHTDGRTVIVVADGAGGIGSGDQITNLTNNQIRKPLIGSGKAQPSGFTHKPLNGFMIAATDGFFDYAKRDDITRLVNQTEFFQIPRKCIELVRLPSGDMWDDVGVVACRNKLSQHQTRTKYEI